ncbi:MAG: hypothetical protein ACYC6Y_06670, partial [Thermoguttaceae bacterium]
MATLPHPTTRTTADSSIGPWPSSGPNPGAGDRREAVDYLGAVAAFGRCVAAGPGTDVLLHDACELAALMLGADLIMVARLSPDAKRLELQVASFTKEGAIVVQNLEGISPEPDLSMAGFAMNAANVVHSDDIVAERRFTDLLLRRL